MENWPQEKKSKYIFYCTKSKYCNDVQSEEKKSFTHDAKARHQHQILSQIEQTIEIFVKYIYRREIKGIPLLALSREPAKPTNKKMAILTKGND